MNLNEIIEFDMLTYQMKVNSLVICFGAKVKKKNNHDKKNCLDIAVRFRICTQAGYGWVCFSRLENTSHLLANEMFL